jgi:hypothetical protein
LAFIVFRRLMMRVFTNHPLSGRSKTENHFGHFFVNGENLTDRGPVKYGRKRLVGFAEVTHPIKAEQTNLGTQLTKGFGIPMAFISKQAMRFHLPALALIAPKGVIVNRQNLTFFSRSTKGPQDISVSGA